MNKKTFSFLLALCALLFAQRAFAANRGVPVNVNDILYVLFDDNTAVLLKNASTTETVELPSTIQYENKDYTLTTILEGAFSENSRITSVTIPNSVSTIGARAFKNCTGLNSVTIGAFVQSIGEEAFAGCSKLTNVTFYPTTPPDFGEDVFSFNDNTTFDVYASNTVSYEGSFKDYQSPYVFIRILNNNNEKYIGAISEAIWLAANRAALTVEETAAISGYMANILSAEDVQSAPEHELAAHKVITQAGIRQALSSGGLMAEEQTVIDGKITAITNAATLADIYTLQEEALAFIAVHPERMEALAAIEDAMGGITNSAYLNDLVKNQVTAISNATDAETISTNKPTAVNALKAAVPAYKAAQAEYKATLPGDGSTGNGVRITLGTKSLELMNPDKVEFFKVSKE